MAGPHNGPQWSKKEYDESESTSANGREQRQRKTLLDESVWESFRQEHKKWQEEQQRRAYIRQEHEKLQEQWQ